MGLSMKRWAIATAFAGRPRLSTGAAKMVARAATKLMIGKVITW